MSRRVRAVVALALAVSTCFGPSVSAAGQCVSYPGAESGAADEGLRASRRLAILIAKSELGIFDLRLCDPSWNCPFYSEMVAERQAIVQYAQAEEGRLALEGAFKLAKVATAETVGAIVLGAAKDSTFTTATGRVKQLLDSQIKEIDVRLVQLLDEMEPTQEALVHARARYARNQRYLEQVLEHEAAMAANPNILGRSFSRSKEQLVRDIDHSEMLVKGVEYDHRRKLVARADAQKATSVYQRAQGHLTRIENLTTAVSTGVAISNQDLFGSLKGLSKMVTIGADSWLGAVKADRTAALKELERAVADYQLKGSPGLAPRSGFETNSSFVKKIEDAQRRAFSDSDAAGEQLIQRWKEAQKVLDEAIGLGEKVKKSYDEAAKQLTAIETRRAELDSMGMDPRSRDFISYFMAASTAVKELVNFLDDPLINRLTGAVPQVAVIKKILEETARQLGHAADIPTNFARILNSALQGGRKTEDMGYEGLHGLFDPIRGHPHLAGLKAFVSMDNVNVIKIPDAGSWGGEVTLDPEGLNETLKALTLWTSITMKKPTQADLYAVASSKGVALRLELPFMDGGSGRIGFDTSDPYSRSRLARDARRALDEEQAGGAVREIQYLNHALDFLGDPYTLADLRDRSRRAEINAFSTWHHRIDQAYRTAYSADLPPTVFGAIVAHQSLGSKSAVTSAGSRPRTAESVSPLEQRILEARNKRLGEGTSRSVIVDWFDAEQTTATEVYAEIGLQFTGIEAGEVCRGVKVRYPDGTEVEGRAIGNDPFTTEFELPDLDWERMGDSHQVVLTASVRSGGHEDSKDFTLDLEVPIVALQADVSGAADIEPAATDADPDAADGGGDAECDFRLPDVASDLVTVYPGKEIRLSVMARISDGLDEMPEAEFTLTADGGDARTISASQSEIFNGVAYYAEAKTTVPETAAIGSTFVVEATVQAVGATSTTSTRFRVAELPDLSIGSARGVSVVVRRAVEGVEPSDYPPVLGATVRGGSAEPGRTDVYGLAVLDGLESGATSIEVEPPEGAEDLANGTGTIDLKEFDPFCEDDPNDYRIEIVLEPGERDDDSEMAEEGAEAGAGEGEGDADGGAAATATAAGAANDARDAAEVATGACEGAAAEVESAAAVASGLDRAIGDVESGLVTLAGLVDRLDTLLQQARDGASKANTAALELASIRDRMNTLRDAACAKADAIAVAATTEEQSTLLQEVRNAVAEARTMAKGVPRLLAQVGDGAREARLANEEAYGLRSELETIEAAAAGLVSAQAEAEAAIDRARSALVESAVGDEAFAAAATQAAAAVALANASGSAEQIAAAQRSQSAVAAAEEAVRDCQKGAKDSADKAETSLTNLATRAAAARDRLTAMRARLTGGDLAAIAAAAAEADATLSIVRPFAESIIGRADGVMVCGDIAEGNALVPPAGTGSGGSGGPTGGPGSGSGWTATGGVETVDAGDGDAGGTAPPVSDSVIDGLIAQAGAAFNRCDFSTARALADRIAERDPTHPWLASNYGRIVENEKRQQAALAALRRAESAAVSGSLADLAAARAAAQAAASVAPFCMVDEVTGLVATIDDHISRERERERIAANERRDRDRAGFASGLGTLISAIGAVATAVTGDDYTVPPVPVPGAAGGAAGGADLADPCTYKWTFSSVYATEPTCDCPGYEYRGLCVPGGGGGGGGGGGVPGTTEPVTDKDEGTVNVSSRNVRVCVTDVNSVLDDQYTLVVNNSSVGAVAHPEGGSTCYNAVLRSGSNRVELRLVAARGKGTYLQITINGGEFSANFGGTNNHVWTVVAP